MVKYWVFKHRGQWFASTPDSELEPFPTWGEAMVYVNARAYVTEPTA